MPPRAMLSRPVTDGRAFPVTMRAAKACHPVVGQAFEPDLRVFGNKGAQTERRGDAGLVRAFLGGEELTGRFFCCLAAAEGDP